MATTIERRRFLSSGVMGTTGVLLSRLFLHSSFAFSESNPAGAKKPPNIVVIVADDLGWKDVGYHGAEFKTPHIDSLVQDGAALEKFYVCPVCTPTRAGLLTGRYPLRYGLQRRTITSSDTERGIPPEEITLPEMLAQAGYSRRACFGKWHLGNETPSLEFYPLSQGFTHFYGFTSGGATNYFTRETKSKIQEWRRQFDVNYDLGYSTHLIGNEAVRFVEDSSNDAPFFLYVAFNAIHTPNQYPEHYIKRFESISDTKRREKAAMVTAMDDNIGHILQTLERKGIAENTIVWFMSDNGGAIGAGSVNEPLRGEKHYVFEGGIRVPAVVRWSGKIPAGKKIDTPVSYLDVYPTLQSIVGVDARQDTSFDGENVLDIIKGKVTDRDWEFHSYFQFWLAGKLAKTGEDKRIFTHEWNAVNTHEWKMVRLGPKVVDVDNLYDDAELSLFKIQQDPYEKNNVAEQHPDIVRDFLEKIRKFRSLQPKELKNVLLDTPKEGEN